MGYEPDCNCPDCVAMRNGTYEPVSLESVEQMKIDFNKNREKILLRRAKNKKNRKKESK